ncbi:MAG: TetR/AcrR family transcriptional regulator [Pseudomonadota bacterium]
MKKNKKEQTSSTTKSRADRILDAARKLFLKKGYQHTTIRDICRASRLSNGTVYFHFKNKDAIYARIYQECFRFLIDMMGAAHRDDMPPFVQIETGLKTYLKFFIEHREMWEMLDISYRRLALPAELIACFDGMVQTAYDFIHRAVQAYLEERGLAGRYDSLELAMLLITSIDGLLYNYKQGFFEDILEDTHLTLEKLVDRQISIFKMALGNIT